MDSSFSPSGIGSEGVELIVIGGVSHSPSEVMEEVQALTFDRKTGQHYLTEKAEEKISKILQTAREEAKKVCLNNKKV